MSIEVTVPALGESIVEATVGRWLKGEGDPVVLLPALQSWVAPAAVYDAVLMPAAFLLLRGLDACLPQRAYYQIPLRRRIRNRIAVRLPSVVDARPLDHTIDMIPVLDRTLQCLQQDD